MNPVQGQALRNILETQQVAALGTLHDGEPYVSMVPYALLSGGRGFVVHVSGLAAHTRDMLAHPAVSLLVVAPREPGEPVQGLARATIQGRAAQIPEADPRHVEAKTVYLARFPQSEPMFGLADFSVFVVEPRSVRFVGGFAQATSITAETYAAVMGGGD